MSYSLYEIKGFSRSYDYDALETATRIWLLCFQGISPTEIAEASANPPAPYDVPELPIIGSAYPSNEKVRLVSYDVKDNGNGSITYTAHYQRQSDTKAPVTTLLWEPIYYENEPACDPVEGKAILLPTNLPFAKVPNVRTLGLRRITRKNFVTYPTDLLTSSGKINSNDFTVDGVKVVSHAGLLSVRIYALANGGKDSNGNLYKWAADIMLEVRSTPVILAPGDEVIDIGHDIALPLVGTAFLSTTTHKVVASTLLDEDGHSETIKETPVLLTDSGEKFEPPISEDSVPGAFYSRFSVFNECAFSTAWFS